MQSHSPTQQRSKSPLASAVVLLCILAAFAVLVLVGLRRKKADESKLVEARRLLQMAVDDTSDQDSLRRSRSAAGILAEYIEKGGERINAAQLLLAAAIATEFILDERAPASYDDRMKDLIENTNLAECDTGDLILAEQLFESALRMQLADKVIDHLMDRQENRADTLKRAIKVRQKVGRDKDVLANCDELAALQPEDSLPWQTKALVFEKYGFDERLVETYKNVIDLSPDSAAEYQPKLVQCLIATGRTTEAREQFDLFQRNFPNTAKKQKRLAAEIQLLDGDAANLESDLRQRLNADPGDVSALLKLSKIALSRKQNEELLALRQRLEQQAQKNPNNIAIRLGLAELCERLGQSHDAKTWLESADRIKQSLAGK